MGLQKKELVASEKEDEQVTSYRLLTSLLNTIILAVS